MNACATLKLLCYFCTFSSLGFEPLDEDGRLFFEDEDVADLLRLLLVRFFLRSIA